MVQRAVIDSPSKIRFFDRIRIQSKVCVRAMDLDQLDLATLLSRFLKQLGLGYPDRQAQRDLIRLPGSKRINHRHSFKWIDCSHCTPGALRGASKRLPANPWATGTYGDDHFLPALGETKVFIKQPADIRWSHEDRR